MDFSSAELTHILIDLNINTGEFSGLETFFPAAHRGSVSEGAGQTSSL